jgi:hypothetical protein
MAFGLSIEPDSAVQIWNYPIGRFGAVERGAHEELFGNRIDEFLIAQNLVACVKKNAGDLGDESFFVRTVDAQICGATYTAPGRNRRFTLAESAWSVFNRSTVQGWGALNF